MCMDNIFYATPTITLFISLLPAGTCQIIRTVEYVDERLVPNSRVFIFEYYNKCMSTHVDRRARALEAKKIHKICTADVVSRRIES